METVLVDLGKQENMARSGLTYTAISRVTTLNSLFLPDRPTQRLREIGTGITLRAVREEYKRFRGMDILADKE
jgi:hypothetical protein